MFCFMCWNANFVSGSSFHWFCPLCLFLGSSQRSPVCRTHMPIPGTPRCLWALG
jgi:hypothetical protein